MEGASQPKSMTFCSESRKEATRPTPLLSPRHLLKLGAWNIRTLYEAGRATQVAKEMKSYNISVLGLSEVRWTQAGETRLATGEYILHSGHMEENAHHTEGVALMLTPEARRSLIGWEPISPRIVTGLFTTNQPKINLSIIQCYAPTNEAEEEAKEDFYNQLKSVLDKQKDRDVTILMGDFNAKIGNDNTGNEDIMGKHGVGEKNDNGERFIEVCSLNQMVIGGSVFPHKKIHKTTWISPNHCTENQIDHMCINKKFRRSCEDVRVKRGADVPTDHHLVVMKLKLRLKRYDNNRNNRKKYNVELLKNENVKMLFRMKLTNRYQILKDELEQDETSNYINWEKTQEVFTKTCQEVLSKMKTNHKS